MATENLQNMNGFSRPPGHIFLLIASIWALAACGRATAPLATITPTERPALPPVTPTIPTPGSTDTPAPAATPLPPTPEPTATPTPVPSATADLAGVGLPCPVTPPAKPDYASYVLSAEPWPTLAAAAALPPLSLADPLPAGGRNTGYPYGSDGSGRYLLHNGLDMSDENDTLAVAPADGAVIIARGDTDEMFGWRCDWYGQLVVMELDQRQDGQPVYVLFGHIKDVQVSEGERVARGQPVAREGAAGVAVVPLLHLVVRVGSNTFGATRNPLLRIEPWSGSGIVAGRLVDQDGRAWQGVAVTLIDKTGAVPFLNTWTYLDDPDHLIRPDPALAENFVFGPVSAGSYDVYTRIQGVEYRQTVEVMEGGLSAVEIVTEPYRTPTPEATGTP